MNTIKIVCYGTLMTGECNHHYCRHAVSIKRCTFKGTLYDTGLGYPAVQLNGESDVCGELIEVPAADWTDIDVLEDYPGEYDRKEIEVAPEGGGFDKGWVYFMDKLPEQATLIPGGNWKKRT